MELKVEDDRKENPEVNLGQIQQLFPNPSTEVDILMVYPWRPCRWHLMRIYTPSKNDWGKNLGPTKQNQNGTWNHNAIASYHRWATKAQRGKGTYPSSPCRTKTGAQVNQFPIKSPWMGGSRYYTVVDKVISSPMPLISPDSSCHSTNTLYSHLFDPLVIFRTCHPFSLSLPCWVVFILLPLPGLLSSNPRIPPLG